MMNHRQVVRIDTAKAQKRLKECKHWGAFFRLAPHFQPQLDPFHCAIANAVIALNSFGITGSPFRQPTLLSSATDSIKRRDQLATGKNPGLTLEQLERLAGHFGLKARATFALDRPKNLTAFRNALITSCRTGRRILVANFTFEVVLGAGGGHFSPLGAYHAASDSALVLDVANHRTGWYWAPVDLLYRAMVATDAASGKPRGYLVVSAV